MKARENSRAFVIPNTGLPQSFPLDAHRMGMTSDTPAVLEALAHYDVRVARTALVDSAEGAIAFAQRREAADHRLVPIVLFDATHPLSKAQWTALEDEGTIRETFDRLRSGGAQQIVAQIAEPLGETLTIRGERRESAGRIISLASATHVVERTIPLGELGAQEMASNYEGYGHHGHRESQRRMIAHLLERASRFFEESELTAMRIVVRLHENDYTTIDASCTPPPKHLHERLAHRAHDRKGDDYHPAGKQ